VFYQMLHTADTHAGISIDMTQSIRDVCSRFIQLYEDFSYRMLVKWYHFVTVDYGYALMCMLWTCMSDCTRQISYQPYNCSPIMLIMHKLILLITFDMTLVSLNCKIFYLRIKLENLRAFICSTSLPHYEINNLKWKQSLILFLYESPLRSELCKEILVCSDQAYVVYKQYVCYLLKNWIQWLELVSCFMEHCSCQISIYWWRIYWVKYCICHFSFRSIWLKS
jgi:hypothetical protein